MKKAPSAISRATILPIAMARSIKTDFPVLASRRSTTSEGWNSQINSDCVFTGSGSCEQQWGWDITGAYRHYWIPNWSSGLYGSYMEVHYPADALAAFGGAVGVSNLKEGRVGTNLIWTPIKNFDVGAEFMYVHLNQTRPAGLAQMQCSRPQVCRPSGPT